MLKEPETFLEKTQDFYKYNRKRLFKLLAFIIFCFVSIAGIKGVSTAMYSYKLNKSVNAGVDEISHIIQNVRTLYNMYGSNAENISDLLIKSGTLPQSSIQNGVIKNFFGGNVIVLSRFKNVDSKAESSFLLGYQGLSQEVCVKLAGLNWGDVSKGFIAEAIGYVDENGVDSALFDIDDDGQKVIAVKGDDGRTRYVEVKRKKMYTVAKLGDSQTIYPIPESTAISGCSCGTARNCSFVLRYLIKADN